MPGDIKPKIAKLIVTSAGLELARRTRSALRKAVPGARIRRGGFKGVFTLEAENPDPFGLAELVWRECGGWIGHVTVVLLEVESRLEAIRDAAISIGREQVGAEESFSFRLHKRGAHLLECDTLTLEREIGGAIWTALKEQHGVEPRVRLKNPDIAVVAEVLGPLAAVGVSRRAWNEALGAD